MLSKDVDQRGLETMRTFSYEIKQMGSGIFKLFTFKIFFFYVFYILLYGLMIPTYEEFETKYNTKVKNFTPSFITTVVRTSSSIS
jgi:hypothetical protein